MDLGEENLANPCTPDPSPNLPTHLIPPDHDKPPMPPHNSNDAPIHNIVPPSISQQCQINPLPILHPLVFPTPEPTHARLHLIPPDNPYPVPNVIMSMSGPPENFCLS